MLKPRKRSNLSDLRSASGRRSGAFMIVAMMCLLLTTALLGTLLKMAVLGRQQAKVEAAALQADWLAESALDRAAAKLAKDPAYAGETWNIPAEDLDGLHAGRVVISLKPGSPKNLAEVEVAASFPAEGTLGVKRTKRLSVNTNPQAAVAVFQEHAPALAEKIGRRGDGEGGR